MSFSVVPFTLITMMPVIKALEVIHKEGFQQGSSPFRSTEEERALHLIDKWVKLHRVRVGLGAGAWIIGLSALVVSM